MTRFEPQKSQSCIGSALGAVFWYLRYLACVAFLLCEDGSLRTTNRRRSRARVAAVAGTDGTDPHPSRALSFSLHYTPPLGHHMSI